MAAKPRILLIGTADTKSPELTFLRDCIRDAGGDVMFMDIGVLARGTLKAEIPNDAVAAAADSTLAEICALGDENLAMAKMAKGAAALAEAQAHAKLSAGGPVSDYMVQTLIRVEKLRLTIERHPGQVFDFDQWSVPRAA